MLPCYTLEQPITPAESLQDLLEALGSQEVVPVPQTLTKVKPSLKECWFENLALLMGGHLSKTQFPLLQRDLNDGLGSVSFQGAARP